MDWISSGVPALEPEPVALADHLLAERGLHCSANCPAVRTQSPRSVSLHDPLTDRVTRARLHVNSIVASSARHFPSAHCTGASVDYWQDVTG